MNKGGFTLLELVIVLGLITLLTHLAVRETSRWRSNQLHVQAGKTFEELRGAIIGTDFERDADGVRVRHGFLADMGRLPFAQPAPEDASRLTLSELWVAPLDEAERFAIRPATSGNLLDGDATDADAGVFVPCGWRGGYLRLPFGRTRLTDPWGNPMETPDAAKYLTRLCDAAGHPIANTNTPIAMIRHFGADGTPDTTRLPETEADHDGVLELLRNADGTDNAAALTNASLTVTLTLLDEHGAASAVTGASATARIYGPYGGQIVVVKKNISFLNGAGTTTLHGLTPGPRVLRITYNGTLKTPPRVVLIQPGANQASERLVIHTEYAPGEDDE